MYQRVTDRARKVMQLANSVSNRFKHEYIGPEHVLLALIEEGSGVAANVLKNLDVDLGKVRREVEKFMQPGEYPALEGGLPQTPGIRRSSSTGWKKRTASITTIWEPSTSSWGCCEGRKALPPRYSTIAV